MITINGSYGEGGGQILRSSLALSLVTGQPFRIEHIRAGRKRPGLMRQHLTAVNAAVEISQAQVKGNTIGSQELTFEPQAIQPGRYYWAVGTAGSTTLVLQTILPALLSAESSSELIFEGGTHNPFAPPYDFLAKSFVPVINQMGPQIETDLIRPGFYPAGGGKFRVTVSPAPLTRIDLMERGDIKQRLARALVAQLPESIGKRELETVKKMLGWEEANLLCETMRPSRGPGNTISIEVTSEAVTEVFTGFGTKGLHAHKVPVPAIKDCRLYLASEAVVGKHLADQLMIPMALAGGGKYRTVPLTLHAQTNMDVIKQFMDIDIAVTELDKHCVEVSIER